MGWGGGGGGGGTSSRTTQGIDTNWGNSGHSTWNRWFGIPSREYESNEPIIMAATAVRTPAVKAPNYYRLQRTFHHSNDGTLTQTMNSTQFLTTSYKPGLILSVTI